MQIITGTAYEQELDHPTRFEESNQRLDDIVLEIIQDVRQNQDASLLKYTKKFDQATLSSLRVTEEEFSEAKSLVSNQFKQAIQQAAENIRLFHAEQKEKSWFMNPTDEIMLGQKVTPLDSVGVYVPGGKASYPSTVLMNVIPAKIAGVPAIAITTPPNADGTVNPHVLYAARLAGVDHVYKVGGAQAIAALAYGTETITKVNKIVGPGNAFVARAKKWVYGDVAIDMIAGPSEICVVADETAIPKYVAADLLSQAEHDENAASICIALNETIAQDIQKEVMSQLNMLERFDIANASIEANGRIVVAKDRDEAFKLVNKLAPEHLQLMLASPEEQMHQIKHAGAIFLGNYSPEPLGDYFAGPNHTLPTSGTAAFASPLGVYDFLKKSSIIRYSKQALLESADAIATIANMEGLTAHAKAITIRKEDE